MRFFLHTYDVEENWPITREQSVWGCKKDGAGLATKARQLSAGDIIIVRDAVMESVNRFLGFSSCRPLAFFGYCTVAGPVFDQRPESPYGALLWHDEKTERRIIYPIRVPVTFEGLPRLDLSQVTWESLDSLKFRNQKGALLCGRQAWAKKLMGNFIESANEVAAFSALLRLGKL